MAPPPPPPLRKTLLAALIAAAVSLALAHLLRGAYLALGGTPVPEIGALSTTLAALLPVLLAGFAYGVARRWIPRGRTVFTVGTLAFGALSAVPQVIAPMSPGMEILSPPLHVVVAASAALVIPRWSERAAGTPALPAPRSSI